MSHWFEQEDHRESQGGDISDSPTGLLKTTSQRGSLTYIEDELGRGEEGLPELHEAKRVRYYGIRISPPVILTWPHRPPVFDPQPSGGTRN